MQLTMKYYDFIEFAQIDPLLKSGLQKVLIRNILLDLENALPLISLKLT